MRRAAAPSLVLAVALAGCATLTGGPSRDAVEARRLKAQALERDGALRPALEMTSIGLAIDPDDRALQEQRARLHARIERSVAERLEQARAAVSRRAYLEARRHFLAVLALDPANAAAFDGLRHEVKEIRFVTHTVRQGETLGSIAQRYYGDRSRSEVIWEINQLPKNPRLATGASLRVPEIPGVPFLLSPREGGPPEPPRATPPRDDVAPEVDPLVAEIRDALERHNYAEALADADRLLAGNPRHAEAIGLKKTIVAGLVRQRYNEGLRLYREEKLEQAIAEWKAVLELDPRHPSARKNIEQAELILRKLEERTKR